jgi:hypothetical protein
MVHPLSQVQAGNARKPIPCTFGRAIQHAAAARAPCRSRPAAAPDRIELPGFARFRLQVPV